MKTNIFSKMKVFFKNPFILIGLVLAVLLVYFLIQANPKNEGKISRGDIRSFLSASGKLDAEKKAELSFKTTGRVDSVEVSEGDQVKKDEVLARLDVKELSLSLGRAQDDLRQAEAELAKIYDEIKGHDTDETYTQKQTRTQAEVKKDKAVKSVESAKKSITDSALYAPFSGVIINQSLEVNEWVSAFSLEPEIVLIDPATVYFSAEVDEENIQDVKVGQKAIVSFDAYPDRKFDGEVYYIAQSVTQTEGGDVVGVRIKLENFSEKPIIGINGDTEITLEDRKDVLLVPKEAVYKNGENSFVKTGLGEKKIKLGIFDGVNWEVLEGVEDGEKIRW